MVHCDFIYDLLWLAFCSSNPPFNDFFFWSLFMSRAFATHKRIDIFFSIVFFLCESGASTARVSPVLFTSKLLLMLNAFLCHDHYIPAQSPVCSDCHIYSRLRGTSTWRGYNLFRLTLSVQVSGDFNPNAFVNVRKSAFSLLIPLFFLK